MTDTRELEAAIARSGIPKQELAQSIGVSRSAFLKKSKNETEFKATEIIALQKLLSLTDVERDKIFFAANGD